MSTTPQKRISPSVSFADVAHQTLVFDGSDETARLVLTLIDTRWVQRLRRIRQTGNTNLVYMFSEHSRFGHSLGVAYLASELMTHLEKRFPDQVRPYMNAVAAAALLHDVGHVAPGSHLAATMWAPDAYDQHEEVSIRVVTEDAEVSGILRRVSADLPDLVARILASDPKLPAWTTALISGGGWNADRGNWTIVDSAMCSVTYGRYNVRALIDAFQLSTSGDLVLHESRLDALTHFFVARDSMYRQVYQHRVLQSADALTRNIVARLRDVLDEAGGAAVEPQTVRERLSSRGVFCDETLGQVLASRNYATDLPLSAIFELTESWWHYHLDRWCGAGDTILADLAQRLRDRRLFKTVRVDLPPAATGPSADSSAILTEARRIAGELGFDPRYYVSTVDSTDRHRGKRESAPLVLRDNGTIVPASDVEPLVEALLERPAVPRTWLAVPREVKEKLGRFR